MHRLELSPDGVLPPTFSKPMSRLTVQLAPGAVKVFSITNDYVAHGVNDWQFDEHGLMRWRHASINDVPIDASDRKFFWDHSEPRPLAHPVLSDFGFSPACADRRSARADLGSYSRSEMSRLGGIPTVYSRYGGNHDQSAQ